MINLSVHHKVHKGASMLKSKMHAPGLLSDHCSCQWPMGKSPSSCV